MLVKTFDSYRRPKMFLRNVLCIFAYLYIKIQNSSCDEGISLAFAIDDTLSMWDDIDQVKHEAKAIMETVLTEKSSEVKDLVLVTINDPDVVLRTRTNSITNFLHHLNDIHTHNYQNQDCAEMSLTGIEKALLASRPGSYIYVFTDASAKDYYKVEEIKALCQKKQSQVVFVLTGDCGSPSDLKYTVYHEIAAASSGQVFRMKKSQVHSVLKVIKELLKGKHTGLTRKIIPRTDTYVPVTFTIDEMADYALVSTSGTNVFLRLSKTNHLYGPEPVAEQVMWTDNGKVLKLLNPEPGTYYAWVKGESATSVVVYARTDFTFEHGFSTLKPKSMKDTSKQPIAGRESHLSVNVTDREHLVTIKSAQILDANDDHIIIELLLRKTDENFYITDAFVSPTHMYKIAVVGTVIKTSQPITRISKTTVQPQPPPVRVIPETIPHVKIEEGAILDVDYNANVSLSCKVRAHPEPKIEWYTSSGEVLPTQSSLIEETTYISYLKLSNIKSNETYFCQAKNKVGYGKPSKTRVALRPVFKTIFVPAAITTANYGEDSKIECNIKSTHPIKIRWYRSGKELGNDYIHGISADGSVLTLKSMDLGMEGKYTCEASLNSDPTMKQSHHTDVKIVGLVRPTIAPSNKDIHVKKDENLDINCKIVKGHPKPNVKWFKKNGDSFVQLQQTGDVLSIPKALLTHAGRYKCEAENVLGKESAEFEVTIKGLPEITIVEPERTFSYNSGVLLTCKVESNPRPTIVWKNEKGIILHTEVSQVNQYEFTNQLKLENVKKSAGYFCVATNTLGSTTEQVGFTVLSPFKIQEHISGDTRIHYGNAETLRCHITSSLPIKIQWYRKESGVKLTLIPIHSSDKFMISRNGADMKIKFMDVGMDGKYICEVSLAEEPEEKVTFSTNVKVVGLASPEVTDSTSVINSKILTAICRIKGIPKPTISWQFQPKGSQMFSEIAGSEEELNISELKLKHSGVYRCLVENSVGKTYRDLNVVVKEPPVITNEKTNYFGVVGDKFLKITCNVTGFPDPTIVWITDGEPVDKGSNYTVEKNTLIIKNPMEMDTKVFTCEAKNNLGTASKPFNVEVVDNFEGDSYYYGDKHYIYALEQKPVSIKCNVPDSKIRSVRWFMNGRETNQTGISYIINKATFWLEANYTCRFNTDEEYKSENYILDVGFPPSFENTNKLPIIVDWHEEDDILNCRVYSKPSAQVKWLHNGKQIHKQNNVQTPIITEWGAYSCNATNVHGSVQKSFRVITKGCYLTKAMGSPNKPLISDANSNKMLNTISNSDLILKEHEKVKFSCPVDSNEFQMFPSQKEIIAQCDTQDKFIVNGKTYRYSDLQCKTKVESSVKHTNEKCGYNSEMLQVGFPVNGFLDVYKVCYDKSKNLPMFASTSALLLKIGNGAELLTGKWSSALELGAGKPTGGYNCKGSNKCCYSKAQLVNVDELAFGPAQIASFKENLNSIAVWNPCDDRITWQQLEQKIKSASDFYEKWSVWTGASEYTSKNGGLVPRYLWKVMEYDDESSAIVYVNDESPLLSDIRCTVPCKSVVNMDDEYVYCCSRAEFSKVFGVDLTMLR